MEVLIIYIFNVIVGLDVKIKSKFLSGLGPATSSSSPPLAEAGAKELPFSQEILDVAAADSDEQGNFKV